MEQLTAGHRVKRFVKSGRRYLIVFRVLWHGGFIRSILALATKLGDWKSRWLCNEAKRLKEYRPEEFSSHPKSSIEQLTAVHTCKVLQECRNLIIHLRQEDRSIDEFLEYMRNTNFQRRKTLAIPTPEKVCPDCGGRMLLYPGDDNDSHWVCRQCRFSTYNQESFKEIIIGGLKNGTD